MSTFDIKKIDQLRDLPDMIPVLRDLYEPWRVRVFNREQHECRNYLSPNRRDFYKILVVTKGIGLFTSGLNTYYVDKPTILYIHPSDIITWKNLTPGEVGGYYVLFRKTFSDEQPMLKTTIEKYGLFNDNIRKVIRLTNERTAVICELFEKMKSEEISLQRYNEDAIQTYIQLLMLESSREASFPEPDTVSEEFRHVHAFFELLEKETARINYDQPIRLRSAKEFALSLSIHPNHLNALLKKHTGENLSTQIKNRLLEESKVLLLHTDWSLQDIAVSIGFAEQSNFNQFFKKHTGVTPNSFRKGYQP
ncbi:MAG: AraC family transcriptional regulator [Chitinophagaceae bacterium]|nr:MAG: AraC family transcriptional regulator [Chitinophagaceae bacterium]